MSITEMRTVRATQMEVKTTDKGRIEIQLGDESTEITCVLDVASAFEVSRQLLNSISEVIDKATLAMTDPESETLQ